MKKYFFLMFFSVIIACDGDKKKESNDGNQTKIAAILPLTGSAAIWGSNALKGILLAKKELEENGFHFELIIEDTKSETKNSVSALQKVINTNNIQVVIGDIESSSILAMAPIAEKNQVVLLSPGASNPEISNAGEFIFRNWQSDALEGTVGADFVFKKFSKKKTSILYVNNAYGVGLKNAFTKRLQDLGGEIENAEGFDEGASNVITQLQKIKSRNPDVVYMPGYPNEMALALRQAKEIGLKTQFISTQSFDDPSIIRTAGLAAEGVIYSIPTPPDSTNQLVKNFTMNYRSMHGSNPGVCSNTGYDATKIVIKALSSGAKSGQDIKTFLNDSINDYPGAAGITTFDENGDVSRDFVFKIIENQRSNVIPNY